MLSHCHILTQQNCSKQHSSHSNDYFCTPNFYHKCVHMKLSQFKFNLPKELIAQYPTAHRDESRLMVLHRKTGKIEHKMFTDILDYFDEGDVFVLNDTKVFPARLFGNKEKTGAKIEVFLL